MTTNNSDITIRTATHDDVDITVKLLKANFINDSILVWIIENFDKRNIAFDDFFHMYVTAGINCGIVNLAETPNLGVVGAAVWLPHDVNTDTEVETLVNTYTAEFLNYSDIMHEHYPPVEPFFQLATTAVDSSAHGCGIGGALIAHQLNEYDKLGMPTYLEATTRRVAGGLYSRLGYQPIGQTILFPNGAEAYPMWRPAQEPNSVFASLKQVNITQKYPMLDSVMQFGKFDWRVIDVQDDKALLLCDTVIESGKFHEQYEAVTWENSGLRKYLNGDFYNTFSSEEKSKILRLPISNYSNPWFGTSSGGETKDYVFLLGVDGVVKYFGDSKQLRSKNANSSYYINDHFNDARKAVDTNGMFACWWLRTSGNLPELATFITADGRISMGGDFVNRSSKYSAGIRPSIWIKLKE
ncbi:MAG: GNAT family N-acetyltransferase [Defluviitaleaceae bacterium]|nr:GNAT family N-acetyltransferase [Defluviitaleaceae bacterium]